MDFNMVEYWVWEQASKKNWKRVLQCMKKKFVQKELPSSWLSALLLHQVRDEWRKTGKADLRTLISVHEVLMSTIKLYQRELKRKIPFMEHMNLIYSCKAVMVVMRFKVSPPTNENSWKKAVDELFSPIWNAQTWNQIKHRYNIKDSTIQGQISHIHSIMRQRLSKREPIKEREILNNFQMEIKKSFPVLEEFLLQLQPSTLEKIKGSNTKLNRKIEFVAEYLKDGISEDTLFNILRELDVRRIRFRCQQMLKMMDNSYKNVETGEIIDVAIVTLPPSLSDQNEESSTTFQPLTDKLPPIPSSIILRKDGVLQDFSVSTSYPISKDGLQFEPFWLCEKTDNAQLPVPVDQIKKEKEVEEAMPVVPATTTTPLQINQTYIVARTTVTAEPTGTPKKNSVNRLSLTKSGSPRVVLSPVIIRAEAAISTDHILHSPETEFAPPKPRSSSSTSSAVANTAQVAQRPQTARRSQPLPRKKSNSKVCPSSSKGSDDELPEAGSTSSSSEWRLSEPSASNESVASDQELRSTRTSARKESRPALAPVASRTRRKTASVEAVASPTSATDSATDFQPVSKKRRTRQTPSSPVRSAPETNAEEETADSVRKTTTKRKLSMVDSVQGVNRSPKTKRQFVESVDEMLKTVPPAVEKLKQNSDRLHLCQSTASHALVLDRFLGRVLRSHDPLLVPLNVETSANQVNSSSRAVIRNPKRT